MKKNIIVLKTKKYFKLFDNLLYIMTQIKLYTRIKYKLHFIIKLNLL